MSANLLRRAAAKLREHAEAATAGPWTVERFDVDADGVLYEVVAGTDADVARPVPFATRTEDAGYYSQAEADVSYAALVHPPVALSLADLIDDEAENVDDDGELYCVSGAVLGVARAVLREPRVVGEAGSEATQKDLGPGSTYPEPGPLVDMHLPGCPAAVDDGGPCRCDYAEPAGRPLEDHDATCECRACVPMSDDGGEP